MISKMISEVTEPCEPVNDDIILITQFYISSSHLRQQEIIECLNFNLKNPLISKIIIITEREYTEPELQLADANYKTKLIQINVKERMKYSHAFSIVDRYNFKGYIIIANSDIFFDNTLQNLYTSGLSSKKMIYSLLRFEYTDPDLNKCNLYSDSNGPYNYAQDTWIYHSNFNINKSQQLVTKFELGKLGCDNHINYIFAILGYKIYNEPYYIKTYHNHKSNFRTYTSNITDRVPSPYVWITPAVPQTHPYCVNRTQNDWKYNIYEENNQLFYYIQYKISNNINFILPRLQCGSETMICSTAIPILENKNLITKVEMVRLQKMCRILKNNAGIQLSNIPSILKYATMYLNAFAGSDTYFEWDPTGRLQFLKEHQEFINQKCNNKTKFWGYTLDVFHNIYNNPWTRALKGKRLLIISPFINSMKEKLNILPQIYGVDLFPECSFIFIKPPQTHASNPANEFDIELDNFMNQIKKIKQHFDIALCSCGGYGNLVCYEIYKLNKSAIYIGGVLQMYFGIYGKRWLQERPDILRLFINKHWTRPSKEETPDGYQNIEGGCYW